MELQIHFSFILTNQFGERIYGNSLVFYEPASPEVLRLFHSQNYTNTGKLFVPKALCILSGFSFTEGYKEILKTLIAIQFSKSPLPIERIVCNLMEEIPIPDKGSVKVEYDIGNTTVEFYRPLDQLPPYATVTPNQFIPSPPALSSSSAP